MKDRTKSKNKYIRKNSRGVDSVGSKIVNTCKNCFKATAKKKYKIKDKKKRKTKIIHEDPSGKDTNVTIGTSSVTGREKGDKRLFDIKLGGKVWNKKEKVGTHPEPSLNIESTTDPDGNEKRWEKHDDYTSIT
jgi:hypothetical protein